MSTRRFLNLVLRGVAVVLLGVIGGILVVVGVTYWRGGEAVVWAQIQDIGGQVATWRWVSAPGLRATDPALASLYESARRTYLQRHRNLNPPPEAAVIYPLFVHGLLVPDLIPRGFSSWEDLDDMYREADCEVSFLVLLPVKCRFGSIQVEVNYARWKHPRPECPPVVIGGEDASRRERYDCRRSGGAWDCRPASGADT